jgi:hypothetical protein
MTTTDPPRKSWWAIVKTFRTGGTAWEGRVWAETEAGAFKEVLGRLQDGYGTVITTVKEETE